MPGKSTTRTSPTTITYDGKPHTNPTDIANILNNHYINIGHKTSEKIPNYGTEEQKEKEEKQTEKPFQLRHITEEQLQKYMKKIDPNKANDIYKIKPAIIKDLNDYLPPILTPLFNESIDENEYPDALKYTKLIELYKTGDRTLPINYRPISLLPIIAKLLDTIINDQLMDYLLQNDLISPTQYAFRPNSSTTLALQTIINDIHKNKQNHNPTLAIYIDLSKAYDTVSHQKLLHKLQTEFNFTPGTVAFFKSYFQNRQQETHTQHAKSDIGLITHGIPQGSTLSTTLFLLYINNIIKTVPKSTVYTYADDTTLIITANNEHELQQLAQTDLNNLIKYFHTNNLVPNNTKTIFSTFHTHDISNIELKMTDHLCTKKLAHTKTAKLLGMYVQNNLKYNETITAIIRKLQKVVNALRYAATLLPRDYMRNLYYTHVYPHLIGSISIWGTSQSNKEYMIPLIRTQKKIIRIVCKKPPRTPTAPLMQQLKILNLPNLYVLRVCAEMHPHVHPSKQDTNRPQNDHVYVAVTDIHGHETRYSKGHIFSPNKNNHFTQRHIQEWNKLPPILRNTKSLPTFKKELKIHLLEEQKKNCT